MRNAIKSALILFSASCLPVHAVDPGEAAVAFLKSLRDEGQGLEELLKESVLSPHTGVVRKSAISQRLGRMGRYLRDNQFQFKVLGEQRDGEIAGIVISAVSKHDPLEVNVLTVGLLQKENRWAIAPVLGYFDNVDLRYDEVLEKRVEVLEDWMVSERVKHLRELHLAALRTFRERMSKAVPLSKIEGANPEQLVREFIGACRKGDLHAAMVLLGQFESDLTEEDRALQRVMSRGLQGMDRRKHWRLLTSPGVVRLVVQEDPGDDLDAEVSLLVFDPNAGKTISLVRFVLLYAGKRWTIELPSSLRLADQDRVSFQRAIFQGQDDDEDKELKNKFEKFFEKQNEPLRAKTLQEAGVEIERVLREGTLEEFFRLVHRSEDLSSSERRSAYRWLGEFWSEVHPDNKAASEGELIDVIEHGGSGVLAYHLISTSQLDRINLTSLVLLKDESGWGIAPGVTTAGNYAGLDQEKRNEQDEVVAMFVEKKDELTKKARSGLMKRFVPATPADGKVVRAEDAGELVTTFRTLLREGKLLEAFECSALLDPEEGAWEALKALSYEYRGARLAKMPDREIHVIGGQGWAAVTLRVDSGLGSVPDYPMYLVVAAEGGPRIVVDVGLRLATNKGREVLNRNVWKRIDAQLEEKESALVRLLFEGHVERSKTDLAEWEKSNKSSP